MDILKWFRREKPARFDNGGINGWKVIVNPDSDTGINGVYVDGKACLQLGTAYRGIDLISSIVGGCDAITYQVGDNNSRTHYTDHPAYGLLYRRPNALTTPPEFVSKLVADAILYGGGFAWIEKFEGEPIALYNLNPETTKPIIVYTENNLIPEIRYQTEAMGTRGSTQTVYLRPDEVIHVKALSDATGWGGLGLLDVARSTVGLSVAANKFTAVYLNNSGCLHVIISTDGEFQNDQQKRDFLEQFKTRHEGIDNAFKPAFAPTNSKIEVIQIDAEKAALIELQERLDRQILNFLGLSGNRGNVPGVGSSYGSINAEMSNEVIAVYSKWMRRVEAALEQKLLTEAEKESGNVQIELDRSGLIYADPDAHASRVINLWRNDLMSFEQAMDNLNLPTKRAGTYYSDRKPQENNGQQPNNLDA